MTPFFLRLKFAFRTFFAILFRDRIPADVASVLAGPAAMSEPRERATDAGIDAGATAAQVLAVLQRDGRLIDFLMEDITPYADAQIGAAVRNVHAGCREALQKYLVLAPVLQGDEGAGITIDAGTDASQVKLIGNIAGKPPFRGVVRHRGWLVSRIELPALPATDRSVIAPAEVEVS
jgi:hypothetical protein